MVLSGQENRRVSLLMRMRLLPRWRLSCAAAMWWPSFPTAALAESMKSCRDGWKNFVACNAHDQPRPGILPNSAGVDFLDYFYSARSADRVSLDADHRQSRFPLLAWHVAGAVRPQGCRRKGEAGGSGQDRSGGHLYLYVEPCFQP